MSSALAPYANCTLNLEILSGYSFNETTLQEEAIKTNLPVRALLLVDSKTVINQNSGVDIQELKVKGRCLNPVRLPPTIIFPIDVKISFDDGRKGIFTMMLDIPSPYYNEIYLLGQPIHGTVKYTG